MKKNVLWRLFGFLPFFFLPLTFFPENTPATEKYVFERMLPTLEQPWYFFNPSGVAIDRRGYVYLSDEDGHRVQKFTTSGAFIMRWGREGNADGEFYNPSGIALDEQGHVYVVDSWNNRIQKFSSSGTFIAKWGNYGSADGEFISPNGIAVDGRNNVYVADSGNHRIQQFNSSGEFLLKWGSNGSADGEFSVPYGIAMGNLGEFYISDLGNNRIQKFSASLEFITKWGYSGRGDGEFDRPAGLALDGQENVYVVDRDNHRIQKFSASGMFINSWGNCCEDDGEFALPSGVALDGQGNVYVADSSNNRIQKFSSSGTFITKWASDCSTNVVFSSPDGIASDHQGNVYIADSGRDQIKKFNSSGGFVRKWGSRGSVDGELKDPTDIALDDQGNLFVVDSDNHRIQKFSPSGMFVAKWGNEGSADGEFFDPFGIALDGQGNLYVTDTGNHRIQEFSPSGAFITKWGSEGIADGEFNYPTGIALDGHDNVYVVDSWNERIQKFSASGEFITKWGSGGEVGDFFGIGGIAIDDQDAVYVADSGRIQKFGSSGTLLLKFGEFGSKPGSLSHPHGLAITPNGRIWVADTTNNRIQVFKPFTTGSNNKAIILAGGGAYSGNDLWDATQMVANFAYRTLTYQGFTKESIYYLTSDTDLDLDSNGVLDDVDADATNSNLQQAITEWAADADGVLLYLVDHGGNGTFRMSGTETLAAADLKGWLDTLQTQMPGKVTVIYDACNSGSFLQTLKPAAGLERILITSTSPGENAKFVTQGSVSFSNYFWSDIFKGFSIKDAFQGTEQALKASFDDQNPLLDANGNGVANEPEDFELTKNTYIGNGTVIVGEAPEIGSVSPAQTISGESSADLYADSVTDKDGIGRVWAVIRTPDYVQGDADNPVTSLPSIDLMPVGNDRYEATFKEFNIAGTYQIAIYAMDGIGNTAVPQLTTVSVENPLRRRAVIVAGGPESNPLWPAIETNANAAHEALCFQGYASDDIYFLSPVTFSTGVDGTPTLSNLTYALGTWAETDTQDLVLYMIGNGEAGVFDLNETESVSATDLDYLLDDLQQQISGKVTVIYEGDFSGSFLPLLTPPAGMERIAIASTSDTESAHFLSDKNVCFSNYFWSRIYNGSNVRDAFLHGKKAMAFDGHGQVAQMDDNGNGTGNEKDDGHLARNYTIGAGIMLAGDDPIVASVSSPQTIGGTSATIWAKKVTSTGEITRVWAVILPTGYAGSAFDPANPLPTMELTPSGNHDYEGTYENFSLSGTYAIAVFAMDTDGAISLPAQTAVTVSSDCLAVSSNLSIQVPCATYNGNSYGFTLVFYPNPGDPSGFYWKLDRSTLTTGAESDCIPIEADLSMPMDCVLYNGRKYGFNLKFYSNPYDPSGLYWVMDKGSLAVK